MNQIFQTLFLLKIERPIGIVCLGNTRLVTITVITMTIPDYSIQGKTNRQGSLLFLQVSGEYVSCPNLYKDISLGKKIRWLILTFYNVIIFSPSRNILWTF